MNTKDLKEAISLKIKNAEYDVQRYLNEIISHVDDLMSEEHKNGYDEGYAQGNEDGYDSACDEKEERDSDYVD